MMRPDMNMIDFLSFSSFIIHQINPNHYVIIDSTLSVLLDNTPCLHQSKWFLLQGVPQWLMQNLSQNAREIFLLSIIMKHPEDVAV